MSVPCEGSGTPSDAGFCDDPIERASRASLDHQTDARRLHGNGQHLLAAEHLAHALLAELELARTAPDMEPDPDAYF